MIICSCNVITDGDIDGVLIDLLNRPDAPVPTPGIVYRELQKRMNCCGCAPLAVSFIYERLHALEDEGKVCRYRCANIRSKLRVIIAKAAPQAPTLASPTPAQSKNRKILKRA
jgi:hypothetical protein